MLAVDAALRGEALTGFLDRVAPFGCPAPPSLIRAYSLPDAPYPSILLAEHEGAPDGLGDAYRRFATGPRPLWLAALEGSGPGLWPVLVWRAGPGRAFLNGSSRDSALRELGWTTPGLPDDYLGRGLLLLADPALPVAWASTMSLGGVTKARKITGREFPVWIDLPAHQPDLLQSPLLATAERLLAS